MIDFRVEIKIPHQVKYLGVLITEDGSVRKDLGKSIARATGVLKRLSQLWAHGGVSTGWKVKIYRTCVIPIITYGMETAPLTVTDQRRMDAFHHRALRKVLRIPSTHYTKNINPDTPTVSNREVGHRAGIPTISQTVSKHRVKFLGQVLRGGQGELVHSTCFTPALNIRELRGPNRRGRPRTDWLKKALEEAWKYATQLHPHQQRDDMGGEFVLPHSVIPLRKAAQDVCWWEKILVEVPTRILGNFGQGL